MGRMLEVQGREIAVEMSPEFESQLDVALVKDLDLVDVTMETGRLWKLADGTWRAKAPKSGEVAFDAGWDTFDSSRLLAGDENEVIRVYLASALHSERRRKGLRRLSSL